MQPLVPFIFATLIVLPSSVRADGGVALVKQFGAAFNEHDADAMAAMVSDSFQLFYVSGNGRAELATTGPAALKREMASYFKGLPTVSSTFGQFSEAGDFVSFRETVSWTGRDGEAKKQASIAVYQIEGTKLGRAWYYPAGSVQNASADPE